MFGHISSESPALPAIPDCLPESLSFRGLHGSIVGGLKKAQVHDAEFRVHVNIPGTQRKTI
jgi:hypothetical protein